MAEIVLATRPLTKEGFAAYGNVIETEGANHFPINAGTIERFHDLAKVDIGAEQGDESRVLISIVSCNQPSHSPHRISTIERHPLGSQAFIPLAETRMIVVVAPAEETLDITKLVAFCSNGKQGVNYARGVWHMPLIASKHGQQFLVVDRGGITTNCDEIHLDHSQKVSVEF